jgi:hypothetical protein
MVLPLLLETIATDLVKLNYQLGEDEYKSACSKFEIVNLPELKDFFIDQQNRIQELQMSLGGMQY